MTTHRIIIDTDIGDDVDDLLAVALATREPDLELAGITTVFRNTLLRAKMARFFLHSFSETPDIPVHAGSGSPLRQSADLEEIPCQYTPDMDDCHPDSTDAVGFLAETLKHEKLSVVCIGPLTNIALLVRDHPDVIQNLERLVIMGGCYYRHATEWNIVCDPEAADIVFTSGIPIRAVGLDVTTRCRVTQAQLDAIDSSSPKNAFLLQACRAWKEASSHLPILHDPLTVYSLLDRDLEFRSERIHIELEGRHTRGMTYCEPYAIWGQTVAQPNVDVARQVDSEKFVQHFLEKVFDYR